MSKEHFFVPYKPGLNGTTPKGPWGNLEIAEVMTEDHRMAPTEYWIHAHGSTPDEALAAATAYLERNGLREGVFEIGKGSILSTDRADKKSLGFFFQLTPVDSARAHEFCSELHAGTGASIWDNEPMDESDPYDPGADKAFIEYLHRHARGPQPF